ncbi:MAG: hypothetical protein AAB550_01450 [Patescibacteria group bacterium]
MNQPKSNIYIFLIPAIFFVLVLTAIAIKIKLPSAATTQSPLSPVSVSTKKTLILDSPAKSLYNQIVGFSIEDPELNIPVFDNKISLPED